MKKVIFKSNLGICLVFASLLAGCGSKTFVEKNQKPAALVNLASNKANLTPLWQFDSNAKNAKENYRFDLVNSGQFFYTANDRGEVFKLNLDGSKAWSKTVANNLTTGVGTDGKLVVVSDNAGNIYGVDANNGNTLWKQNLGSISLAPALVTASHVVVTSNNGLVTGINSKTGKTTWQFKMNASEFSLRGSAKPVLIANDVAVVASSSGRVHAFKIKTGVPLWVRRMSLVGGTTDFEQINDLDADPVYFDYTLYTASYQSHIIALDLQTREEVFRKRLSSTKKPAVTNDFVFVVSDKDDVVALERKTGAAKWVQKGLAYRKLTNAVTVGDKVYVGDEDGYIHLLDTSSGAIVGRKKISGKIDSLSLLSAANQLVVRTVDGKFSVWQVQ